MAPTPSVKVTKTLNVKGNTRRWSNRYHFNGGTPADATHWHTLMDNIVAAEKLGLASNVTIVDCEGYNAGSDLPIASKTYSQAGSITLAGGEVWLPGEMTYMLKWSTTARSTKNHPIYLFSYIHGIKSNPSDGIGTIQSAQYTALNTYGTAWVTGFSDGSITAVRAGPNGATGAYVTPSWQPYCNSRDFPR